MAETKAHILTALEENIHRLPAHMVDGTMHYVLHGRPVGGFLTALFSGDLEGAEARADHLNGSFFDTWLDFMQKAMPVKAFGSPLKVAAWQKMRGLDGYPDGG